MTSLFTSVNDSITSWTVAFGKILTLTDVNNDVIQCDGVHSGRIGQFWKFQPTKGAPSILVQRVLGPIVVTILREILHRRARKGSLHLYQTMAPKTGALNLVRPIQFSDLLRA
jgi:hypothetical protein